MALLPSLVAFKTLKFASASVGPLPGIDSRSKSILASCSVV
jgi:hypothetical protein